MRSAWDLGLPNIQFFKTLYIFHWSMPHRPPALGRARLATGAMSGRVALWTGDGGEVNDA
jgi:hypothetical protein